MKTQKILDQIRTKVEKKIEDLYEKSDVTVQINMPTDKTKADLVITSAFSLSKIICKSPVDIANQICEAVNQDRDLSEYVEFTASPPGFINLTFKNEFLNLLVKDILETDKSYGKNTLLKNQIWVVEHTSPNPNKAMHLGHLRNNLIGMAISRTFEFSGAKVIYDAIDNNRGIAIAKAMWGFLIHKRKDGKRIEDVKYWYEHQNEWNQPLDLHQKPDHFIGECYLLGSEDFKSDTLSEKGIRDMVVKWENGDLLIWALWEKMLEYAHKGIQETLKRLDNRWDNIWQEHEHYKKGKELVERGLKKGLFKKLDNGAILTSLSEYSLPDTIVLKSDGTSLYITQDLALTKLKKELFKADKLIWVIGPEQSLAMKQLFAVCEQLGIGKLDEFDHVSYGLVNVQTKSGTIKKMSSRGGEVLLIDDFIDGTKEALLSSDRGYTDKVAEEIAIAAIKLAILKPSRTSNITINIKNSISLEGDSGLYLLYTYARMKSLLSKDTTKKTSINFSLKKNEYTLTSHLLYFPMIVANSLEDYMPNFIVDYLFDLAHLFNSLYAEDRFISDDKEETNKKMVITLATLTVFSNAFNILGVKPLNKV